MSARVLPPPDERHEWSPVPDGFQVEWVQEERSLLIAEGDLLKCRRPGCRTPATWKLRRSNGWWSYCSDHHYGREIREDGVYHRRLVPVERRAGDGR